MARNGERLGAAHLFFNDNEAKTTEMLLDAINILASHGETLMLG